MGSKANLCSRPENGPKRMPPFRGLRRTTKHLPYRADGPAPSGAARHRAAGLCLDRRGGRSLGPGGSGVGLVLSGRLARHLEDDPGRGRTFLRAPADRNAEAVQAGAEQLETTIDGQPWVQQPFPYQAKRLMWLGGGVRRPSRCGACLGGCGARRRRL